MVVLTGPNFEIFLFKNLTILIILYSKNYIRIRISIRILNI